MKDTEEVLKLGGFNIKYWIVSGNIDHKDVNIVNQKEEKCMDSSRTHSEMSFPKKIRINFTSKVRKIRSEPDMGGEEYRLNFLTTLTRRMILGQVSTIYDPIGLILPITLKAKLMMRSMICGGSIPDKHEDRKSPG